MENPYSEPVNVANQQQTSNHTVTASHPPLYPTNEYNPLVDPTPGQAQSARQQEYPQIEEPTNVQVYPNSETTSLIDVNPTPAPQPAPPQTYPENIPTSDNNPFVNSPSISDSHPSQGQPYQNQAYTQAPSGQYPNPPAYPTNEEKKDFDDGQSDKSKPIKIEAIWVESTVDQDHLFYYEPNGRAITPSKYAYYPPVKQIVYDKEGRAYKAHFPPAVTNTQKLAQGQSKFDRKVMKPIGKSLDKFADVMNDAARGLSKLFRPRK
ncbi:choriogenin, putative [Trichomonas vaginalis G3]|uniref:Choriogenin, putative n=1 Tax=Trichomonas vaginalis (strain ATCC PRA-98 / G3) TaxID=412133 RepID=A2F2E8_TRIV3|nr:hypothetical protein TVAGG3_0252970 [Trichomonas vaginalis G3]EAY00914.1 choriogenin, putative [Trichomonas vaginalis G3]KAI5554153.1 hypothetical protein TVAGG3_0252970 [Trichomonas vaginalis G3]|eukprot:XP_001313843.1 choriogenin [Trichomonas vaginalis G3]